MLDIQQAKLIKDQPIPVSIKGTKDILYLSIFLCPTADKSIFLEGEYNYSKWKNVYIKFFLKKLQEEQAFF